MKYINPVIRGYYPDPSVCRANGKYYLVASSFHHFPGVPLFESDDLINWRQIGFCLTRKSQLDLTGRYSSEGIFAPTIRYHEGRFYMVTTDRSNFFVWTDDIYGEWSEPIFVDQGGIDPSLYFEGGKTYFTSNGSDETGRGTIYQCEINPETGERLTESRAIWQGTGGRYLESPHIYKIGGYYYLTAAEGGTEYGHMVTYARGESIYGPFESYAKNPVLTNRNSDGIIQGVGHADLVEDYSGNWWIFHLGFRQIGRWMAFHHLGREVFLMPVTFGEDGWFTVGENGTTVQEVETDRIPAHVVQRLTRRETFEGTRWAVDWQVLREFKPELYRFGEDSLGLCANGVTLDEPGTPAFIGIHQKEFDMELSVKVRVPDGEAGVTIIMDENHRCDLALVNDGEKCAAILRVCIGDIRHEKARVDLSCDEATLRISANAYGYTFSLAGAEAHLGTAQSRYLSTELASGFTGVLIGLYAQNSKNGGWAEFSAFECVYPETP